MQTIADWIARAAQRLAGVTETPRLDAELILAHALGISRAALLAGLRDTTPDSPEAEAFFARRARGEPLAYLFGRWEFFSLEFEVEPPALVPRPETEHLVETVLDFIGGRPARVLDLCTGTGCVAVSIAANAPPAQVVAADIEPKYVALARRNAQRHGVADRIECLESDLFLGAKHLETFDVVCANPPYVEAGAWATLAQTIRDYEDPRALVAGTDGLDVIRAIIAGVPDYLRAGGLLALEIGRGQAGAVRRLLDAAGYRSVAFRRDLAGIERIATALAPPAPTGQRAQGQEFVGRVRLYRSDGL